MKKNGVQKKTLVNDSPVSRADMILDGLSKQRKLWYMYAIKPGEDPGRGNQSEQVDLFYEVFDLIGTLA